jgi:hypothetical protein
MKHFKIHQSQEDYEEYIDIKEADEIGYPRVDWIEGNERCTYLGSKPPHDYSKDYLTVEALEDGIINFSGPEYGYNFQQNNITSVSYSTDGGKTWITETDFSERIDIVVQVRKGDKVLWKGTAKQYGELSNDISIGLSSSKTVSISGNIMSMIWGDDFKTNSEFKENTHDVFYGFISNEFHGYSQVIDASNLILPAINLVTGCYRKLFSECGTLEIPPRLPSANLAESCYSGMFFYCPTLKEAPELLATTLASNCYDSMFNGCRSLENAPQLPATTLTDYCYYNMFAGCTSLTAAPNLPATTLADSCYYQMFGGCTSLIYVPELPATTLADNCYAGMFFRCTALTIAPELPAVTLISNCYVTMFSGCTSLNYIKMLATDISATNCLVSWVDGVAASGTFIKNANTTIPTGTSGIPSGWTVQTASE